MLINIIASDTRLSLPYFSLLKNVIIQKQKDSFVRDRSLVLQELQHAAEHRSRAGQHAILEREGVPRAETSIHALVTNIVRYDTEDSKAAVPMATWMNSNGSRSKRHMDAIGCNPAS